MPDTVIKLMRKVEPTGTAFRWQRNDGEWIGPEHTSGEAAMEFARTGSMISGSELASFNQGMRQSLDAIGEAFVKDWEATKEQGA